MQPQHDEVVGDDAVRSRLYQLAAGARREVWTTNPGPAPSQRALAASRAMDELSRTRGVRSRSIFSTEVLLSEPMCAYLGEVVAAGDEVREVLAAMGTEAPALTKYPGECRFCGYKRVRWCGGVSEPAVTP